MKKNKMLSIVSCAAAVCMIAAGCSSGTSTTATTAATVSVEKLEDGTKTEETAASEAVEAGGKTIVYWSMWEATEPQGKAIQQAVDAYQSATGNTVDLQFKGRAGIREGLEPALDAGTTIDIFDESLDRVNANWSRYLLDLEPYMAQSNYEETANKALLQAGRDLQGGTLKCIPYQPNMFAFFYNNKIFKEAGVTEAPQTWDEFLSACEKIKAAGYIPLTGDDAYMTHLIGYHLGRMIGEEGVLDIVNNGNWAENEAVLKMAEDYENLYNNGYISSNIGSNVFPLGQNGEFALGEAAMYFTGSWLPNELKNIIESDFEWGCFSYPALKDGVNGVETANFGAQCFAINNTSQVSDEAFELICYITQGEFDMLLSQESMGIPADSRNTNWPEEMMSVKPVMEKLTDRFSFSVGIQNNVNMTPVIKEKFIELCAGKLTAEDFVSEMEAASK